MFEEGISGTLMNVKKSNQTSLGFTVWFPFVRSHMKIIQEGSLMAVRNFSSSNDVDHYSVMRITSVMPTHYAMMTSMDGYPGFVEEAAMSASKDWNQDRPIEDTTKIVCDAVPSRFEITRPRYMDNSEPEMAPETNLPMPGERVKLLNAEWTRRIINHDLQKQDGTVALGTLANMKEVEILALWDSMIRTHFGVFAYTNAGKSNLLSTVTSKIFEADSVAKTVIYDLMGEYGILLMDVLCDVPEAYIVCMSENTIPSSVMKFWKNCDNDNFLEDAANDIVKTTVLPKSLQNKKSLMVDPMKQVLQDGKIKLYVPKDSLGYQIQSLYNELPNMQGAATGEAHRFFNSLIEKNNNVNTTAESIQKTINYVNEWKPETGNLTNTINVAINIFKTGLDSIRKNISMADEIDDKFLISMDAITKTLRNKATKSLFIIQGNNDFDVRIMSSRLGEKMLEIRRKHGEISPPVSFVYDEADQFIAQDDKPSGMKESKYAAEQLARRGRKYGLGIGIATQRIVYLDTNILGQPHTYFVSKLPRASDREKIQEAFGLSDETLQESLRFNVGQWLLISHSATGIDGLPIPIQLPDANTRISDFLNSRETDRQ